MKKSYGAYMTVEAALILPFTVMLIAGCIRMGFFMYNRTFSTQVYYLSALRGSQEKKMDETQIKAYVKENIEILMKNSLFKTDFEPEEITVSPIQITVNQNGVYRATRINPTQYIRIAQSF